MMEENEQDLKEMEDALNEKVKEASDALERLEELTAMLQEARDSEEKCLQQRTESDAETFRLQRELDRLRAQQNAVSNGSTGNEVLLTQLNKTNDERELLERTLVDLQKRMASVNDDFAKQKSAWHQKDKETEEVIKELRKCLRIAMGNLSQCQTTISTSGGVLSGLEAEVRRLYEMQ
ncbi:hypothetical protein STCU_12368 [Strigomonas culicis]|uniref:Uncharacterized protein n=1 Tax=Strigomonas culicis TaxID=28005 RepID=S9TAP9_9TRYP|nr:hypothetical protein STCU_12368 [Strigomonas culicis]|eukprot:EPY15057.1 hypothetical protein STCU_12368 [Strigomonas culicis]